MVKREIYNFKRIEKKWQNAWEKKKVFQVKKGKNKKKKYYVLDMFPYPSGTGLHMGHAFVFSLNDIFARFKRLQGFNVLYPPGYDALGLPAENAAIKAGTHPEEYTKNSIKNFMKQQKAMGWSYDWNRLIKTSDPNYYKWDQWIFLKMFEKGLAYRKKSSVNYCPKCQTVLANEQVINGMCWRHSDTDVETKELEQWFFKITNYAEELYDNIDKLKDWPERAKTMQKNWINKKVWIDIDYKISGVNKKVTVSTTRPDTNFGATFVVIAPEHPLISRQEALVPKEKRKQVDDYIKQAKKKTEQERMDEKGKKTGVFTGLYCINDLTKKKMPIWVTDFIMMNVGTGVVVGVPGHDKRDFDFAKQFNIPIVKVVVGKDNDKSEITRKEQVQEAEGKMINSDFLNGLDINKATKKIMDYLEKKGVGKRVTRYRLRDWLISRQRYWGTPIPIVYCDKCGMQPLKESQLPIKLPKKVKFGKGNPLETSESWIKTSCPKCKNKNAKRETDTMDTFVNSSWYFLRYCDSKNNKQIFNKNKANYWCPINHYVGGPEHISMHLIYMRFYTKFLRDIKLINFDEPALRYFTNGVVKGTDGNRMSKSRGNVIEPLGTINKFGADSLRLFLISNASPDKDFSWDDKGVENSLKFLNKIYNYFHNIKLSKPIDKRIESKLHTTIKEVSDNIENLKYNHAIISIRQLFDYIQGKKINKKTTEVFLTLISPFCPHIAEELWAKLKNKGFISASSWPKYESKKINEKFEKEEQAQEKLREDIRNIINILKKQPKNIYIYTIPKDLEIYNNIENLIAKEHSCEVRIFSSADKNKVDPKNKSKKARPGKPAVYLE